MARIRTIKPDAFTSDTLSRRSPLARWTFVGLMTYCDDEGRGRADVRLIKGALFPLDDTTNLKDLAAAIAELTTQHDDDDDAPVCVYTVGGRSFLHMPKWAQHQKISHPSASKLPECPVHHAESSGAIPEDSGVIQEAIVSAPEPLRPEQGKGNREEGERNKLAPRKRGRRIPDDFTVTDDLRSWARRETPAVGVEWETKKFIEHWQSSSGANASKLDWSKAWQVWMRRAHEHLPQQVQQQATSARLGPWTPPAPPADIADNPELSAQWRRDQVEQHRRAVAS